MASAAGWTSYGAYSFDTNSNTIAGSDRGKSREIASYLKQNPSRRVALDSSDATRVRIVRSDLIAAGVPADRIDSGAYGDAQRRRDGRVEVLFSNEPAPGSFDRKRTAGSIHPAVRLTGRKNAKPAQEQRKVRSKADWFSLRPGAVTAPSAASPASRRHAALRVKGAPPPAERDKA